jgi:hypothetical protein
MTNKKGNFRIGFTARWAIRYTGRVPEAWDVSSGLSVFLIAGNANP